MNDYIKTMRSLIGKERLLTVGCGAIIENEYGEILLQRRKDQNNWGIPGGVMEIGETFIETVTREVLEETGLILYDLKLFGIYSGKRGLQEYQNGDKIFSVQIIFQTNRYTGKLKQNNEESYEHTFFPRHSMPSPINPHQEPFIRDWQKGGYKTVIVK
jgi:ADP-ribose pyrophosphatase YjhB (NUDIX family)